MERQIQHIAPLPVIPAREGVILFLAPEAGVVPHLVAQCIVARTLQELGHRVVFVRCFELFTRCPVMDVYRLPYTASSASVHDICLRCADASLTVLDEYGLEYADLRTVVTPELIARARDAVNAAPRNLLQFEFESIPFGRNCAADVALQRKKASLDAPDAETRAAWLSYIESGLRAYLLITALCERLGVRRVVHCENYSLLLSGALAAGRLGIPATMIAFASHRNIDRRHYLIAPEGLNALDHATVPAWAKWRTVPLLPAQVMEVTEDLLIRFSGKRSHIFSPARNVTETDIRAAIGLSPDTRLLVAFTSSLDELIAQDLVHGERAVSKDDGTRPFADQIEWLQALVDLVRRREDLQLIVRVHPREGAAVRSVASEHLAQLQRTFGTPLPRCQFVWPDEPVSSYDLAEAADVALVSWSSIGLECARMGVPVLSSAGQNDIFPHDDFIELAADRSDYFARLDKLLDRPASIDTITRAFRWYHVAMLGATADVSDVVPHVDSEGMPTFHLPRSARAIEQAVLGEADLFELNLERQIEQRTADSPAVERHALRQQLRRLIHFFCTGDDVSTSFELRLSPERDEILPRDTHGITVNGTSVRYSANGRDYARVSPLCARLAPLAAHQ